MLEWMMMETSIMVLMIYMYFRGQFNLFMKAQNKSSLCYIVASELKGCESFFKYMYHTTPKVCNIFCHI